MPPESNARHARGEASESEPLIGSSQNVHHPDLESGCALGPLVAQPRLNPADPLVARGNGLGPAPVEIVTATTFVNRDDDPVVPLLGTIDQVVMPAGSLSFWYGAGGVGKTTLLLDMIAHAAAGIPWLDITVRRPLRILVLENEGPRAMFRDKLRKKAAGWDGPSFLENLHVVENPWAAVTLADRAHLEAIRDHCERRGIDLVVAGPLKRLGQHGAGTPDETWAFVEHLRQAGLGQTSWAIAHHENKAGEISGAWEGVTDLTVHVRPDGHGRTRITWQKARWSSDLHGLTWSLTWASNAGYTVADRGETTATQRALRRATQLDERVIAWITDHPGCSSKAVEDGVRGNAAAVREALKRLEKTGRATNTSSDPSGRGGTAHAWYPSSDAGSNLVQNDQTSLDDPPSQESQAAELVHSSVPRRADEGGRDEVVASELDPAG